MTSVRAFFSITALSSAALATLTWAATDDKHGGHHPAAATTLVAQAQPMTPGMGMRASAASHGHADQMKAMQQMHDKMMAAKTPEERNALMAEQMKLMHSGMNMMGGMAGMGGGMGGMGGGAAAGKPADMATRQGMMEQRMDMMQSMMQMMMDRMPPAPAAK